MLRNKLIAFGLVGIITFGTTISNTAIVLATPTKAKASNNMMQGMIRSGISRLEKFINEGKLENAINLQKQLKDRMNVLSKIGEDLTDLQKEFDKLSKEINLLKSKNQKIELYERRINNSIENMFSELKNKDYKNISDEFNSLSKDMNKLSKLKPIDKTILDKVENLKYKYNNRQKFDEIDTLIGLIEPQLDNLSNFIKEKNINESISIRKKVESDIKKLTELSKVPESITYKFNQYSKKLDKLINKRYKELIEATRL